MEEKTTEQQLMELKAHAYDVLSVIEQYQAELRATNEQIIKLANTLKDEDGSKKG